MSRPRIAFESGKFFKSDYRLHNNILSESNLLTDDESDSDSGSCDYKENIIKQNYNCEIKETKVTSTVQQRYYERIIESPSPSKKFEIIQDTPSPPDPQPKLTSRSIFTKKPSKDAVVFSTPPLQKRINNLETLSCRSASNHLITHRNINKSNNNVKKLSFNNSPLSSLAISSPMSNKDRYVVHEMKHTQTSFSYRDEDQSLNNNDQTIDDNIDEQLENSHSIFEIISDTDQSDDNNDNEHDSNKIETRNISSSLSRSKRKSKRVSICDGGRSFNSSDKIRLDDTNLDDSDNEDDFKKGRIVTILESPNDSNSDSEETNQNSLSVQLSKTINVSSSSEDSSDNDDAATQPKKVSPGRKNYKTSSDSDDRFEKCLFFFF
jgi:hypothetical protein